MAVMQFRDVADLKREPVEREARSIKHNFPSGFPIPMSKQMSQHGQPQPLSRMAQFAHMVRMGRLKCPSPRRTK